MLRPVWRKIQAIHFHPSAKEKALCWKVHIGLFVTKRLAPVLSAGPDDVHPAHGLQPWHFFHRHAGSAPFQFDVVVHGSLHHDAHSPLAGARTEGWVDGMEVIGRITPADGCEEAKFHDTL